MQKIRCLSPTSDECSSIQVFKRSKKEEEKRKKRMKERYVGELRKVQGVKGVS